MQWINTSSTALYWQQRQCVLLGSPVQYTISLPNPNPNKPHAPLSHTKSNYFISLYQLPVSQLKILFAHENCSDFFRIGKCRFLLQTVTLWLMVYRHCVTSTSFRDTIWIIIGN